MRAPKVNKIDPNYKRSSNLIYELGNNVEIIKDNPSSERLFQAVDFTLYSAAEIVLQSTNLFEEVLAIFYATDTRKKITNLDEHKFSNLVYRFYNCEPNQKLDILIQMKLNRELITLPLQMMTRWTNPYCKYLVSGNPATYQIRQSLLVKNMNTDISLALLRAKECYNRYLGLRDAITQKFYRLIVQDIGKHKYIIGNRIDPEDMAVEYYHALAKAFSMFDTSSGAFANYVKNWFKNARSKSLTTDEMGISYILPHSVRTRLAKGEETGIYNFNVSNSVKSNDNDEVGTVTKAPIEGSVDELANMEKRDEIRLIRDIVTSLDPTGIYRLFNDIEINFVESFGV